MKRLFGLIGFTFLFVLSAVFYSDFNEIVFAIMAHWDCFLLLSVYF